MSATALMPVEEYLRLTEKPYCEYRDGAVWPKARSDKLHSIIQRALSEQTGGEAAGANDACPLSGRS